MTETKNKEPMGYKKLKIVLIKIKGTAILRMHLDKEDKFKDGVDANDRIRDFVYPRSNELVFDRPYDLQLMMGEKRGLTITPTFDKQMKKMGYTHLDIKDIVMKMKRYADKLGNDTYELILNPKIKG